MRLREIRDQYITDRVPANIQTAVHTAIMSKMAEPESGIQPCVYIQIEDTYRHRVSDWLHAAGFHFTKGLKNEVTGEWCADGYTLFRITWGLQ